MKVPPFLGTPVPEKNTIESATQCARRCCEMIEQAWKAVGHPEVRAWTQEDGTVIGSNLEGGLPPRSRV